MAVQGPHPYSYHVVVSWCRWPLGPSVENTFTTAYWMQHHLVVETPTGSLMKLSGRVDESLTIRRTKQVCAGSTLSQTDEFLWIHVNDFPVTISDLLRHYAVSPGNHFPDLFYKVSRVTDSEGINTKRSFYLELPTVPACMRCSPWPCPLWCREPAQCACCPSVFHRHHAENWHAKMCSSDKGVCSPNSLTWRFEVDATKYPYLERKSLRNK